MSKGYDHAATPLWARILANGLALLGFGVLLSSILCIFLLLHGGIGGWDPLESNPVAYTDERGIEYGHDGAPLPPPEWR